MLKYDADTNKISIIAKDIGDFVINISNYLLADGDKVYFTVNKELEKEEPLISIEVSTFVDNKAAIHLSAEHTNLPVGEYFYDVQVNAADGRVDTVLGPAKFKVLGGVKY